MAGETSPDDEVVITFQDPARGELAEDIILSVEIASTGVELAPGNPLVVRIPAGEPLPTVSFDYDRSDTLTLDRAGSGTLNATLNLSEELSEDVKVNIATSGTAVYGNQDDWDLSRRVPAGNEDSHYSLCDTTCEVMFLAGQTSADVQFTAYFGSAGKTVGAEIQLPTETQNFLRVGNPSRLDFTVGAAPPAPTVSLNYTGSASVQEGSTVTMTIALSETLGENVSFNFSLGSDNEATYGISGDFIIRYDGNNGECSPINSCTPTPPNINADGNSIDISISILPDTQVHTDTAAELVSLSLGIANAGTTGLILGSTTSQTFTIAENPLPTVSFNYNGASTVSAGDTVQMTIRLSEALSEAVTLNFINGGTATYGETSGDWNVRLVAVATAPDAVLDLKALGISPCTNITGSGCQITMRMGATRAIAEIELHSGATSGRTIQPSIVLPSASSSLVEFDSSSSTTLTIQ